MRVTVERPVPRVPEAPRHPEVNQEAQPGIESNDQILAAAINLPHALSLEFGRDGGTVERPRQPRVDDLDPLERASDEHGLELDADRLYLGKLRHIASVTAA